MKYLGMKSQHVCDFTWRKTGDTEINGAGAGRVGGRREGGGRETWQNVKN